MELRSVLIYLSKVIQSNMIVLLVTNVQFCCQVHLLFDWIIISFYLMVRNMSKLIWSGLFLKFVGTLYWIVCYHKISFMSLCRPGDYLIMHGQGFCLSACGYVFWHEQCVCTHAHVYCYQCFLCRILYHYYGDFSKRVQHQHGRQKRPGENFLKAFAATLGSHDLFIFLYLCKDRRAQTDKKKSQGTYHVITLIFHEFFTLSIHHLIKSIILLSVNS